MTEDDGEYCLQFEAKAEIEEENDSTSNRELVSLHTKNIKDAAGLYILLKSYIGNRTSR